MNTLELHFLQLLEFRFERILLFPDAFKNRRRRVHLAALGRDLHEGLTEIDGRGFELTGQLFVCLRRKRHLHKRFLSRRDLLFLTSRAD